MCTLYNTQLDTPWIVTFDPNDSGGDSISIEFNIKLSCGVAKAWMDIILALFKL